MFRSTLARAAAAITFSFTAAFTVGTLTAAPTPPAAASPAVVYLDAASTAVRGLAAATHTTPGCATPAAPDGTTITVNAHGDASAPAQPGRLDFACADGTWRRITIPATRPPLPSWLHHRWIHDACGRGHAGEMLYAAGADQSVVVCKNGDIEPS